MALSNALNAFDTMEEAVEYGCERQLQKKESHEESRKDTTEQSSTKKEPHQTIDSSVDDDIVGKENKTYNFTSYANYRNLLENGREFLTTLILDSDEFLFGEASEQELDELMDNRLTLMPWEELCEESGNVIIHEELRSKIFQITQAPSKLNFDDTSEDLQKAKAYDFSKYSVMLTKMMNIDQNLASLHAKLAGRKMKEDKFWNTYLSCVKCTQQDYFSRYKSIQKDSIQGWVNLRDLCLMKDLKGTVVSTHGTVYNEDFVVV